MPLPFPEVWEGWDIPGIREVNATYGPIPLKKLPPLEVPDDLSWLAPIDPRVIARMDENRLPGSQLCAPVFEKSEQTADGARSYWQGQLEFILSQSARAQIQLPNAFVELFRSDKMANRVLDPTGCYFDLPKKGITPDPFGLGGHILRFQNDQQCCVMWYLFVPFSGKAVVLSSPGTREAMFLEELDPLNEAHTSAAIRSTSLSAHSFPEYLFRFWIEGAIYKKCRYKLPFNQVEGDYVRQLRQMP